MFLSANPLTKDEVQNSESSQKKSGTESQMYLLLLVSSKPTPKKKKEMSNPVFKFVFIGDASVGKTSIIIRYHHGIFSLDQQSTIGAGFISKSITTPYGNASVNIWDTAGQERYRSLVPTYSRNANVAIIVFDLTERETFQGLDDWVATIRTENGDNMKIIVAGNKLDMLGSDPDEGEIAKELDSWGAKMGISTIRVSAKTGENIDLLLQMAVNMLPKAAFVLNNAPPDLTEMREVQPKQKCC